MRLYILAALAALPLAGCVHTKEAYQADHNYCAAELGLQKGTDNYAVCRSYQTQLRQARVDAAFEAIGAAATGFACSRDVRWC